MTVFHAVLTRFNVRRGPQADPRALSDAWLGARMRMFEEVTVASMARQARLPDRWLVFFDDHTPQATRDAFERLRALHPALSGVLCAEYCGQLDTGQVVRRLQALAPSQAAWLLSTRLDNDDALHPAFVDRVQALCRPGVAEFINPLHGLIVAPTGLYRKRDASSPFISRSEPMAGCGTVWVDQHQRLARHAPVRQFRDRDAWIQVVHGGNLANQVRGLRVTPKSVAPGVLPPVLAQGLQPVALPRLLYDNSIGLLYRYAGSARRRAVREWVDRRVLR